MEQSENRDRLIAVLESAIKVQRASQFFAWTQGPLHALLPHEILICGMAEGPGQELKLRYFTATRYFKNEHFAAASQPRDGLIAQAVRHWKTTRLPCLFPFPPDAGLCLYDWQSLLARLELRNMAAHGQVAAHGGIQAWFGFFRVAKPDQQTSYVLQLLLPCITATYARVLSQEAAASPPAGGRLSVREVQVLELVRDGCSNQEIAERLAISPMTAKNHVQNIRAKLKVRTRGQAVSEAVRLGSMASRRHET